ncbi:hypothetical protein SDJN02_11373, partial [Cucurbita argyrosperma subsp. argyrosperma]
MAPFLFLLFIFASALLDSAAVAAEPPSARKLGNHWSAAAVSSSPSEAPQSEIKVLENREHHKSRDMSIAGGGVILGGLATTFFVAIICYIRATKRQNSEVK